MPRINLNIRTLSDLDNVDDADFDALYDNTPAEVDDDTRTVISEAARLRRQEERKRFKAINRHLRQVYRDRDR